MNTKEALRVVAGAAFLLALVAIILAAQAWTRLGEVRREIQDLSQRLADVLARGSPTSAGSGTAAPVAPTRPPPVTPPRSAPPPPVTHAPPVAGGATPHAMPVIPTPSGTAVGATFPTPGAPAAHAHPGSHVPVPLPAPSAPTPAARPLPAAREAGDIERELGGSWLVWIGGVALALAGIFLVKYSLDQGWLGPGFRVMLGLLMGVVLVAVGEARVVRSNAARVAQAACAAGVACLFAALLAATDLYHLIPPAAGFAGMAVVTAGAVALSLRHGPFVALLGLLGGFLTPALIRVGEPDAARLFGFLFLLQVGLLPIALRRRWWLIAALAVLFSFGWVLAWLVMRPDQELDPWTGTFVLLTCGLVAALVSLTGFYDRDSAGASAGELLAAAAWLMGLASLGALVHVGRFSPTQWTFLLVLAAGGLAAAAFDARLSTLPFLTAAAGAILLLSWRWTAGGEPQGRFEWVLVAFALLHAAGGFALALSGRRALPGALLAAGATVAYVVVGWLAIPTPPDLPRWGLTALAVAPLHVAAAWILSRRRSDDAPWAAACAALVAGAALLAGFSAGLELHRERVGLAWSLEVVALAWAASALRVPALRGFAVLAAACVSARLLLNPAVLDYPIGRWPVFDWLTWGYGVPIACFLVAAWLMRSSGDDALPHMLEVGACALGAAWMVLEIHHCFHPSSLDHLEASLGEQGVLASAWLGLAAVMALEGERARREVVTVCGGLLCALAVGGTALGPCLATNPAWSSYLVAGVPLFNTLLVAYGLPALLVAGWARALRSHGHEPLAVLASATSLLFGFACVTLEVRQWFRGADLMHGEASSAELYAYSVAWILVGAALLAAGLAARSRALRQAALAVMLLAVAKVFLYDMRALRDLWRVLSFAGLGISLLALGWLYQRFVLRERSAG